MFLSKPSDYSVILLFYVFIEQMRLLFGGRSYLVFSIKLFICSSSSDIVLCVI